MTKISLAVIIIAAAAAIAGCGAGSGTSSRSSNSLTGPADTIALYQAKCISCHAADLSGKVGPDSDLRTVGSRMTQDEIVRQITQGGDIMPPFKDRLQPDEVEALAEWLASRQ